MKNKLQIRIAAIILIFIVAGGLATAQTNNENISGAIDQATGLPLQPTNPLANFKKISPALDPNTGLPLQSAGQANAGIVPGAIDPAAGLPVTPPTIQWIDPDWKGSATILPEINFDGLPLSEVARQLKEKFTNDFDIIFPQFYVTSSDTPIFDPGNNATVTLQLKYVTAIDVFNAMNLQFEAGNVPVRCKLLMNGNRPTVMVTVLPQALPRTPAPPPTPEIKRMVFFVGSLLRQNNSSNIVDTIAHVWDSSSLGQARGLISNTQDTVSANYPSDSTGQVQIYLPAQLLIVSGTSAQIDLAQQTLQALKQKSFSDSDFNKPNPPAGGGTDSK